MTKLGFEPNKVEGRQSAQWILLDYHDVMVHVFQEEARSFYNSGASVVMHCRLISA